MNKFTCQEHFIIKYEAILTAVFAGRKKHSDSSCVLTIFNAPYHCSSTLTTRKEGSVSFNNALNTFYLGSIQIARKETCHCQEMGYSFWLEGIFYMHIPQTG